jgi:hypothetical protein
LEERTSERERREPAAAGENGGRRRRRRNAPAAAAEKGKGTQMKKNFPTTDMYVQEARSQQPSFLISPRHM